VMTDLDASNGVIHVIDTVLTPPAKGADVRRKLEDAVAQGATLYNAGHHDACAKLYEGTMTSLAEMPMNPSLTSHMKQVLQTASKQTCPTERSWTLRHGIDQMYTQLSANH
jgi:transforming growth factor-beta-induced protein